MEYRIGHQFVTFAAIIAMVLLTCQGSISAPDKIPDGQEGPENNQVAIERIAPERAGGQGYKLVYRVNIPMAAYWKFKTDFDNTFLTENKYIRDHRLILIAGRIAITENKYTYGPDVFFRWRTTLSPDDFRLDFILLNPDQCQQKYHYGHINLEPEDECTRVTQVAYFDFWGASFWAHYPWKGGMKEFLSYTATWEQATALRLKDRYHETNDAKK